MSLPGRNLQVADANKRSETVHGTAVAMGEAAVLIRGSPGSGKSDLALRLISRPPNILFPDEMRLVGDDYVSLSADTGGVLRVSAGARSIEGLIEVRGVGIFCLPFVSESKLRVIVDLAAPTERIERLPQEQVTEQLLGCRVPVVRLHPFEVSAPEKVLFSLAAHSKVAGIQRLSSLATPPQSS